MLWGIDMKRNKSIIIIAILLIGLLLLGMFFTKTGFFILKEDTMKVGYVPVLVNLPLFVALEEGMFEKYNLKVEAIEAKSPNYIVDGLVSGQLDGAGVLADNILFSTEEKYPGEIKIFSTQDETKDNFVSAIIIRNDSNIKTINDLKGEKIGVYTGLVQVLFLKSIIIGMGLNVNDIDIIEIDPTLQLKALDSKQFEVLSTVEPYVTIAKSKNIGKVFIENPRVKYILDPFPSVATAISSDFIDKNPKMAKAYILAYDDAIDYIHQNPEQAKKYLVKYTPITDEIVNNVNLPRFNKFGDENRENIQKFADWMYENKQLKSEINVNSMFGNINIKR